MSTKTHFEKEAKGNSEVAYCHLTLKMASTEEVETSVTTNSPSQDSFHRND